jgi:hypothetical protein
MMLSVTCKFGPCVGEALPNVALPSEAHDMVAIPGLRCIWRLSSAMYWQCIFHNDRHRWRQYSGHALETSSHYALVGVDHLCAIASTRHE